MSQIQPKKDKLRSGDRMHMVVNENASSIGGRAVQTLCWDSMFSNKDNYLSWKGVFSKSFRNKDTDGFWILKQTNKYKEKNGGGFFFPLG